MRYFIIALFLCSFIPAYAQWEEKGLPLDSLKFEKPVKEIKRVSKQYRRTGHIWYYTTSTSLYDRDGKIIETNSIIKRYWYNGLIRGNSNPSVTAEKETYHFKDNYLHKKVTSEKAGSDPVVFTTELYDYEVGKLTGIKGFSSEDSVVTLDAKESFTISFEYYADGKRKGRIYTDSSSRDVTEYVYDSLGRYYEVTKKRFINDTIWYSHKAAYRYTRNRQIITGTITSRPNPERRIMTSCKVKNGMVVKRRDWSRVGRSITRNNYTSGGTLKKSVKRERGMVRFKYKVHFTYY